MSYKQGDLTVLVMDEDGPSLDTRDDYRKLEKGEAYLPHSCDQWIIGGRQNILRLIEDLLQVLIDQE